MGWLLPLLAAVSLHVEHARTEEEIDWGLMGREAMEEDSGMLFHFPEVRQRSFWMFNCQVDLDLAFLDEDGIVLEIHPMKAYPEVMDPDRPVRSVEDFSLYPSDDWVCRFFARRAKSSEGPVAYALEMPRGWFAANHVEIGQRLDLGLGVAGS